MWYARAEEYTHCMKCGHDIPAGTDCLSQLPWELPLGTRRSDYMNFCIDCIEWEQGDSPVPCFTLSREHLIHLEKSEDSVSCHSCEETILRNAESFVWTFFAWPVSSEADRNSDDAVVQDLHWEVGPASWLGRLRPGGWDRLSPDTRNLFRIRGLGRGLGIRTPTMARRLYENSIPQSIRDAGEPSVLRFLQEKHASHIRSVARNPGRAKAPSNIVWERPSRNLSRGARNMTAAEVAAANASAQRFAYVVAGKAVARQAGFTAAIEFPIASLENWFHWKRGRKTGEQAIRDTAKSTSASLGSAAALAAIVQVAGLTGVSLSFLAPLAAPLAIGGLAMFAVSSVRRVARAAGHDFPLDELRVYFCLPCMLQNKTCLIERRPASLAVGKPLAADS